jgi:hypothetical protein
MATNKTSSSNPRAENMGDVVDALSSGIVKTAASKPSPSPYSWLQRSRPKLPSSS